MLAATGGVRARLGYRGDSRTDRIQVHVHHAGENGGVVEQALGPEAPLPEASGAVILPVRPPGDGLLEVAHEPAEGPEPLSQAGKTLGTSGERANPGIQLRVRVRGRTRDHQPSAGHLLVAPAPGGRWVGLDDQVEVVAHDGIGMYRDGEHPGELQDSVLDPVLAMVEAAPGQGVIAAEVGTAHASRHAVVRARDVGWHVDMAWIAHGGRLAVAWLGR